MAPLPAIARKRPVRVPTYAMPALIAPAMSRNTLSIACLVFSLSMISCRPLFMEKRGESLSGSHGQHDLSGYASFAEGFVRFLRLGQWEALRDQRLDLVLSHQGQQRGEILSEQRWSQPLEPLDAVRHEAP